MARKLFVTGLIGTAVAAMGCLVLLVVVLTGLAARAPLMAWLDALLLPALAVFGGMLVISLFLRRSN
jgi:mercuric ion transport protein